MYWYLSSHLYERWVTEKDPDSGEDVMIKVETSPGSWSRSALRKINVPGQVCHAYTAENCLVGLPHPEDAPSDWMPLTVEAARAHYETIVGVAPAEGVIV